MRKGTWKPEAAVVAALCLAAAGAPGAEKDKPKGAPQTLLYGSVFQENGFSLRGARVAVSGGQKNRVKKQTVTDLQGEFAVRVPGGQASYTVEVSAEGFTSEKKTVEVTVEERVDMTFRLAARK